MRYHRQNLSLKGENQLYPLQISLTMKYGGNPSRRKAILKSCFGQFGETSPLGIGYTAKSSKERFKDKVRMDKTKLLRRLNRYFTEVRKKKNSSAQKFFTVYLCWF